MMNLYQPDLMEVLDVRQQTADVKSVRVRFRDEARGSEFHFRVGQFGMFSAFGYGESTFNICSSSNWKDFIEFCFRRTGRVTDALWSLEKNDTIGFRGPYGNSYPMEKWVGKNLIFIGGGIAMPPHPLRDLVCVGEPRPVRRHHHRLRCPQSAGPGLPPTNWIAGRNTTECAWCPAWTRAARRPTGTARWASSRR